jgi:hypothetical protein
MHSEQAVLYVKLELILTQLRFQEIAIPALQAHSRTPVGQLHVKHVRVGITPLLVHLRVLHALQALTATELRVKSVAFVLLGLHPSLLLLRMYQRALAALLVISLQ